MSQSKKMSLLEQACNVGSGFMLSLGIWMLVIQPFWGVDMPMSDSLQVTAVFTVASIARGYVWRRLFNKHTNQRERSQ